MRSGSESKDTWTRLKKELDRRGLHYVRIETRVGLGIPDVNVYLPGIGDVWLELKYCEVSSRGSVNIGLRKEQYIWLRDAWKAGRLAYLLALVKRFDGGLEWLLYRSGPEWAKYSANYISIQSLARATSKSPKEALDRLALDIISLHGS